MAGWSDGCTAVGPMLHAGAPGTPRPTWQPSQAGAHVASITTRAGPLSCFTPWFLLSAFCALISSAPSSPPPTRDTSPPHPVKLHKGPGPHNLGPHATQGLSPTHNPCIITPQVIKHTHLTHHAASLLPQASSQQIVPENIIKIGFFSLHSLEILSLQCTLC